MKDQEKNREPIAESELEKITGGKSESGNPTGNSQKMWITCRLCGKSIEADLTKDEVQCGSCKAYNRLYG
ncbi:MAG: hypothetical protein K6G16_06960 [Lachnospiraceae bacterium]|nr:hypothetical protein [Lachnospiraceae bacterium]